MKTTIFTIITCGLFFFSFDVYSNEFSQNPENNNLKDKLIGKWIQNYPCSKCTILTVYDDNAFNEKAVGYKNVSVRNYNYEVIAEDSIKMERLWYDSPWRISRNKVAFYSNDTVLIEKFRINESLTVHPPIMYEVEFVRSENFTYDGKIISMDNLCATVPCLPDNVFGLEIRTEYFGHYNSYENYVLSVDSKRFSDKLNVDGVEYFVGDKVDVTGDLSVKQDLGSKYYYELEVKSIKKNNTAINSIIQNPVIIKQSGKTLTVSFETPFTGQLVLFDISGKIRYSKDIYNENNVVIPVNASGCFVLSVSNNVTKQMVRRKLLF